MSGRESVRALLVGLAAGTTSGLFGVGGGIALVPAFTGLYRLTQHQAHGTSLAVISVTAFAAVIVYGAHASVVWTAAAPMALGSLLTAPLGARLAARTSAGGLRRAFAVFLVLVALRMLIEPSAGTRPALSGAAGILTASLVGGAAGGLAGFMGVGGGIIVVPALTLAFGLSQQAAQGTSLAVMLVTAPAAAIAHTRHGNVMWRLVPLVAVGTAIVAPLAAWGAHGLPHAWLARGFALFLLVTALDTWRGGRRPT